jgi:hypothetical protein
MTVTAMAATTDGNIAATAMTTVTTIKLRTVA